MHSQDASGLVHTHQTKGVSHFIDQIGGEGGAPPGFVDNKETISHARLESHAYRGVLTMRKQRITSQRP